MTTKDCCLSLKDKQHTFVNNVSSQIDTKNLNLNHFNNSSAITSVKSKAQDINNINIKSNDYKTIKDKNEQFTKSLLPKSCESLTLYKNQKEEEFQNQSKNGPNYLNANSSTLSLHIAAYENANPVNEISTKIVVKKNKKQILSGTSLQNFFEIPRQQQDQTSEPEIMQFRTSQRLFNSDDEADKENHPSGSQKSPTSTAILTKEQRQERMPIRGTIQYLCDRIDTLKSILTEQESVQKLQISVTDFIYLCRFVEGNFINFEMGDDLEDPEAMKRIITQAGVATTFINLIEKKLPKEVLIWIISVYINTISNREFGDRLSGTLMNDILTYSKHLSDDFREKLGEEIVDQWAGLLSDSNSFCLNEQWVKHLFAGDLNFDLFSIKSEFEEGDSDRKVLVLRCVLQLLLYGSFDFTQLPDEKLGLLFLCLFKDAFSIRISNLIISLLHKLICADLCNGIFIMHSLDTVFSFLDYFHREPISPGSLEAREKPLIENAVKSCLDKIASIIILPSPMKQLALCKPSSFLPFTARAISLLLSFQLDDSTLLKFVVNSVKNVKNSDDLGENIRIPDSCKQLLRYLIVQCSDREIDNEFIGEIFSFIIRLNGDENTSKFVDTLLQSSSTGDDNTVCINVRQTLVSVLTPLSNTKELLSKVVPDEEEIRKLFEDLQKDTLNSKYLTTIFDIMTKSADFYTGVPETLLSFLSLPWICEMEWQIWEDFKKALPLLVPIKANESKHQKLLSTSSMKALSLKALSQINVRDQWRSFIFKEAIYSAKDAIDVQMAALDALPYMLTTIPSYSFFDVITPLIQSLTKENKITASVESISIVQSLIKAISLCICISGKQYKLLPNKEMECNLCQTRNGNEKTVRMQFPAATFDLIIKIVEIEEEENELKIDLINLLCATVRHILISDEDVEQLIAISLPLISASPGIAISYLDFIQEAIKSNLSETIIHSIHAQIYELQDELLQLDYFVICGLYSAKPDFAFNCMLEVIGKSTIRTSKNPKAVEKAVSMIKVLADRENITPRTYFVRNFVQFCQYIIRRLLNSLAQITTDENVAENEQSDFCDSVIENCFASMAVVFDIISSTKNIQEACRAFLNLATDYLITPLFSFKQGGTMDQTPYFEIIFVKICDTLKKTKSAVVSSALPTMFWHLCYFKNTAWNDFFFRRVEAYSHGFIAAMVKQNYCKCCFAIILSLGKNEEEAKVYLKKIHDAQTDLKPKSLEFTQSIKSIYLGILLELRRTFSDDLYYRYRPDIIKSVVVLIKSLEPKHLSETPGRMLSVLKAAIPIELSLDAWMAFLQKLEPPILEQQIHHVLIAAAPLVDLPGAKKIFEYIFNVRRKIDPMKPSCQRFDRAVLVLYDSQKRLMLENCKSVVKDEPALFSCAKMLNEEAPDVHLHVLPKIIQLLENQKLPMEIFDELIHALLRALKTSTTSQARHLIGICIGKIGAIDPGKIGDSSKNIDRRPLPLKYVSDMLEFLEEILELCGKLLIECSDATKVDFIAMAVQIILKEISPKNSNPTREDVFQKISAETKHAISPYIDSKFKFNMKETPTTTPQPYADHSSSYSNWLWKWYFAASDKVRDRRLSLIFRALQHIYYTGDTSIIQSMISQIVLQGLLEGNTGIIDETCAEASGVFKKALSTNDGWIRMAAQTCFQMIEFIEKFQVDSANSKSQNLAPEVVQRVQDFLKRIVGELREETGELLSVAVAEKYNFACRALRWLEQYGIKVAPVGAVEFNRVAFYGLERIYLQLSDTDGVLGAYETIQNNVTASPQERVVAFEATGDHTEALPLYQQNPVQKMPLVKCLLRLNQPLIAYNLAGSFAAEEENKKIKNKLRDYQIEAAYRRKEWQNLDELLKDTTEKSKEITSWGAHIASIFGGIHDKSKQTFETRIDETRLQVMDSLKAVTMEGADTYTQAYRYIQRLHILHEIEDAAESMKLFNRPAVQNYPHQLFEKWDARSDNAIQCSSILEPIYWVRRELLCFADPVKNKDKIAHYLVESSKLSRQANHLSTSWAHLIHARSLGAEKEMNIDMEEARYFFQRGQKGEAICSLQKTLEKNFPQLVEKMKRYSSKNAGEAGKGAKKTADEVGLLKRDKEDFVNTQLQLTNFIEKANTSNIGDIYLQYSFMDGIADMNEQHAYCFAVFYDNAYYSRNTEETENVMTCLTLYCRVLSFGRRYLLHVMPRILTIWFDYALAMHDKENPIQPTAAKKKKPPSIPKKFSSQTVTDFVSKKLLGLNRYYLITAYPQLISRLCHPDDSVYKVLENIISDLMIVYPHECLWQTISSYRSTEKERCKRTKQIVKIATNKSKSKSNSKNYDFDKLVQDYMNLGKLLIEVAEDGGQHAQSGVFYNFNKKFSELSRFLKNSSVKIAIPFITMVEKNMPTFAASQISLPTEAQDSTVYIQGIEDKYTVYGSLEKPKLIALIGTNGVRYPVIAKRNDELRKDARCLDFCRMVNTLLLRDSEARRRQLHIRTYSVIPLQNCGGLIEVVPNVTHLRGAFSTKDRDNESSRTLNRWQNVKDNKEKRRKFFDEVYEKHPVRMAEYLRTQFTDPCKWYAARLAFTRTAATMSMVGFILGLGDRHCENILIDVTNGDIVHVDFNILFNKGEDLPTPEIVPFRLTRNMIDGFGPTGVEGTFKKTCETVMRVLRQEQATLLTVLETFVHDPLLEWSKLENRNQQSRIAQNNVESGVDNGLLEAAMSLIKARLEGRIVTKKIHPLSKSCIPMSVEGQVAQLIKMAKDPQTLESMYIGWSPHL